MHFVVDKIVKAANNEFFSEFRIMEDLEILELKAKFFLEYLKRDAQLWENYAEQYSNI